MPKLASDHFRETGRPLRIAIDEAGWRFNNLTDAQVAAIRASTLTFNPFTILYFDEANRVVISETSVTRPGETNEPSNPIEKNIFWRLIRLLCWNVQPIFVFDGPGRPWKRGRRGGGKVDYDRLKLLTNLLNAMRIPHHRAPGEAEAECARMQQAGVVDAVWSDDSDTLMFGASMLITDYREDRKKQAQKDQKLVRVYRMRDIAAKHKLDQDGLLCYAILAGGDYDTAGLPKCGPKNALLLAQYGFGTSQSLGRVLRGVQNERDLVVFRLRLTECLLQLKRSIAVSPTFPKWLALKNYKAPKVSSAEQIEALRTRKIWDKQVDHSKLRQIMAEHFNFDTKRYLLKIAPFLLAMRLSSTREGEARNNACFEIQILKKKERKKQENLEEESVPHEITITFNPFAVIQDINPFEPDMSDEDREACQRVECETLRCVLQNGIGDTAFTEQLEAADQTAPKRGKKRKASPQLDEPKASKVRKTPATSQKLSSQSTPKSAGESQHEALDSSRGTSVLQPSSTSVLRTATILPSTERSSPVFQTRSLASFPYESDDDDEDLPTLSLLMGRKDPPLPGRRVELSYVDLTSGVAKTGGLAAPLAPATGNVLKLPQLTPSKQQKPNPEGVIPNVAHKEPIVIDLTDL